MWRYFRDQAIFIFLVLLVFAALFAGFMFIYQTYQDGDVCEQYSDTPTKDIPGKCVSYWERH